MAQFQFLRRQGILICDKQAVFQELIKKAVINFKFFVLFENSSSIYRDNSKAVVLLSFAIAEVFCRDLNIRQGIAATDKNEITDFFIVPPNIHM